MKTKTLSGISLKLFLILPLFLSAIVVITGCSATKKANASKTEIAPPPPPPPPPPPANKIINEQAGEEVPFTVVEQMPVFPGGDSELLKYIATNTKYPAAAKANGTQGRVIVRFCITSEGKVNQSSVLRGVSPEIDAEALRVVNTLPDFTPGVQGGKPVPVWYMVPITFSLGDGLTERASKFEVTGTDTLYTYTKEMPRFPGGNDALRKFKSENIKYDPKLKSMGVEGFVNVRFIIGKDGAVSNITIGQGASPSLDAEALRVTRLMPAWEPGKEKGKAVRFRFSVPYEFVSSPPDAVEVKEGEPYVVVEEMPMFPGGDTALIGYIARNTKYPASAKASNIQGRVIARFCVTENGGIDRVTVLKGVSPELDDEAIRVVKSIPAFKPGKQGGKAVPVWYMVPITFALAPDTAGGKTATPPPPPPPPPLGYDVIPVFKGGEAAMYKFINSTIVYPAKAKENKISGKVRLAFCINTDGSVNEAVVLTGAADPLLATEAIRVVRMLPKWEPGKLEGEPVKVWYPLTVTFTLQ